MFPARIPHRMQNDSARYNVVYHVATLHHWRDLVRGQLALLLRNRSWNSLAVSIATGLLSQTKILKERSNPGFLSKIAARLLIV